MSDLGQPGIGARRMLLCAALAAVGVRVLPGRAVAADAEPSAGVTIDNFTFSPKLLRVTRGMLVHWTNHDDIPHSIVVPQLGVHSPPMDTDGTFAWRFEQAGVFDYMCGLHPFMRGQVVVQG